MDEKLSRREAFNLISVVFVGIFLFACSAPLETITPTVSLTVTRTITPSPTSTASPTATASPTPTSDPVADRLEKNLSPIDSQEGTQHVLVNVQTQIQLDESLADVTDSFQIGDKTIENFVANVFYNIWKKDHPESDFNTFIQTIGLVDSPMTIRTQNLGAVDITLGDLRDQNTDAQVVNKVVIAIVDNESDKFEGLKILGESESGFKMRADLNPQSILILYVAPSFRGYSGWEFDQYTRDFNWAACLSKLPSFLMTGQAKKYNESLIDLLLQGGFKVHYLNK